MLLLAASGKSQEICTVNTNQRLFWVNRLHQGLKNAVANFHKIIGEMLKGLIGCVAYQDYILLYGLTTADPRKRYNVVMERLTSKDFTVNEENCVSFTKFFSSFFLGIRSGTGWYKTQPATHQQITSTAITEECERSRSFHRTDQLLRPKDTELCNKDPVFQRAPMKRQSFRGTNDNQWAFQSKIDELTSKPLLQPSSLDKEVTLTTDAS